MPDPVPALRRPWAGGSWESCPLGDLVGAYMLSGAGKGDPAALAKVWLRDDGRCAAEGGDPHLLSVLKQRREELAQYLSAPCSRCEHGRGEWPIALLDAAGGPVARVCGPCFMSLVDEAAGQPGAAEVEPLRQGRPAA